MTAPKRKPPFGGGPKRPQGNATEDVMGTVRRSPDGSMLAMHWPSRPHPADWMVADRHGSCGYEKLERIAHWPVIGAVPGSPAAGMELVRPDTSEVVR